MRLALARSLAPALPAAAAPVRLATEAAFAPCNLIGDDGQIAGFERDFGAAMDARAAPSCARVVAGRDALVPRLPGGNRDVILAAMTITAERRAGVALTRAKVPPEPSARLARAGESPGLTGLVAARAAPVHADHVAASGATPVGFPATDDVVAAVQRDELDAALADECFLAETAAASAGGPVIAPGGVPRVQGSGLAPRPSGTELRDRTDAAIGTMKRDGTLNALLIKWTGDEVPTF